MKGFIVLHKNYQDLGRETRYIQFGDECAALDEAKRLTRFPNLHEPIIVNLAEVTKTAGKLKLTP